MINTLFATDSNARYDTDNRTVTEQVLEMMQRMQEERNKVAEEKIIQDLEKSKNDKDNEIQTIGNKQFVST